jgi:SnoaL-like domain
MQTRTSRRAFATVAAAVVAAAMVGCTGAPPGSLTASHRAAMRDSVAAFLQAFNRHAAQAQWDSLGALYADDADFRFLESGAVQYRSGQAVRDALRSVPVGTRIENRQDDVTVAPLAPGLASLSATFQTRFIDSTGNGFSFGGALSMVLRHDAEGWRIVSGHSSAPVPRGGR